MIFRDIKIVKLEDLSLTKQRDAQELIALSYQSMSYLCLIKLVCITIDIFLTPFSSIKTFYSISLLEFFLSRKFC